ncbi:hypothetical protein H1R20_g226, partial [Candolleomyces eurysporus]
MKRKQKTKVPKVFDYDPMASAGIGEPQRLSSSSAAPEGGQHVIRSTNMKILPGGDLRIESNPVFVTSTPILTPTSSATPDPAKTADRLPWNSWAASEPEADDFSYRVESGEIPLQFMGTTESSGDQALHSWMGHVDDYLQALISFEGRGEQSVKTSHRETPLHRIKFWNGTFLEKTSLKALGLRIQLGHVAGEECPYPIAARADDFVIIDIDAIHSVGLDFCECGKTANSQYLQLLQHRFYPATSDQPKSAATFRLLEVFEILQYESKLSVYEFYQAVARLTDNTGLELPKNRYNALLRMTHEWRHLKLLKRSGLGHSPTRSAQDAQEGECAVLCPACPHPDINMPPNWEKEPEETRHVHH